MGKHTPGPWGINIESPHIIYEANKGSCIAWLYDDDMPAVPEWERIANARLISAAPEMLEALKALTEEYCMNVDQTRHGGFVIEPETEDCIIAARSAIKKATGQ
jgi:hypothetical protein